MISSKVLVPLLIGVMCVLAVVLGANLATDAGSTISITAATAIGIMLMIFAREYWWITLFVAVGFGGYAYFGFKLYPHECLMVIAMAGLIPSIAINPRTEFAMHRPKLPWFFYATFLYLCFHVIFSMVSYRPNGFIEYGNIIRAYAFGIWPLIFVFLFRWYGRSDYVPFSIYLLQVIYLLRAALTLLTLAYPMTSILPGLNFLLPGNENNGGGLDDLRFAGHGLCLLACALLLSRPSFGAAAWQWLLLAFGLFVHLLGGGRGLLVASIVAIVAAAAASRMWAFLAGAGAVTAICMVFLNLFPNSIDHFDFRVQRALSILVLDQGAASIHAGLESSSDFYHQRLNQEGYDRWMSSIQSFVMGTGIRPWSGSTLRGTNVDTSVWLDAIVAGIADVGNYESALWALLAPVGVVGFVMYLFTIGYFAISNLKRVPRAVGMDLTIAFLGCYPAFEWLLFSPVQGGYPQIEMLFAATAFYYFADRRNALQSVALPSDEGSIYSDAARA